MEIVFTKQAVKDFEKVKTNLVLLKKVKSLLQLIEVNPFSNPPSYEKLVGFENVYSRRINIQYRLVYQVFTDIDVIKIIRMWTHHE